MIPPWQEFPEIPRGSIGWRMGSGEDYMQDFNAWFLRKHPEARERYAAEYPEPEGWEGFYAARA